MAEWKSSDPSAKQRAGSASFSSRWKRRAGWWMAAPPRRSSSARAFSSSRSRSSAPPPSLSSFALFGGVVLMAPRELVKRAVADLATFPFERPVAWTGTLCLAVVTLLVSHGVIG